MKELELYIHIPFCTRKCEYCDFLSAPAGEEVRALYLEALKREIEEFAHHPYPSRDLPSSRGLYREEYEVSTVFFGGGTPSLLTGDQIAQLMGLIRESFRFTSCGKGKADSGAGTRCGGDTYRGLEPEITLECNPGTADREKLEQYRRAGINRISFGLQSAKNEELKALGRIHTWEDFCRTYEAARAAGFSNINVDLMSALPGQTRKSWEETLRKVLALKPEHISAYSLIIEEGTPFYQRYREDDERRARGDQPLFLPSEEEERQMYRRTQELLEEQGFYRYEISNYARPGFACRHNIGYWTGVEYAGFGLGASSLLGRTRCRNPEDLGAYLKKYGKNVADGPAVLCSGSAVRETEPLSRQDEMEEFMFLGLRLTEGVSEREFLRRFHQPIREVYGDTLEKLKQKGLLECKGGQISLTPVGIDVSNQVMAEFLF